MEPIQDANNKRDLVVWCNQIVLKNLELGNHLSFKKFEKVVVTLTKCQCYFNDQD